MEIIIGFIFLLLIVLVLKHPEWGVFSTLVLIAFSPIFDKILSPNIRFMGIAVVFLIELINYYSNKIKKNIYIIPFVFIVLIKELICFFNVGSVQSLILAFYEYIVIVGIVYFNVKQFRTKKSSFLNQYKIYIVLCLVVQLIRALVDYSFWGYATLPNSDPRYQELYMIGGELFRPSSLQGEIIYAIELAFLICCMMLNEGVTLKNILLFLASIVGLFMTSSRSGIVMVFVCACYFFFKKRQLIPSLLTGLAFLILTLQFNMLDRFLEMFDFQSSTYQTRFLSINTVAKVIDSFGPIDWFFGVGSGSANYADENGIFKYYVENFYLYLIINNGITAFLAFCLLIFEVIKKGIKDSHNNLLILLCILGVNILACSLSAYTIQIVVWILVFAIYNKNKMLLNESSKLSHFHA